MRQAKIASIVIAAILAIPLTGAFWNSISSHVSGTNGFFEAKNFALATVGVVDYTTTGTSYTVERNQTGKVFTCSEISEDPITFILPACRAGLIYTFVDLDATAAADLIIDTQTGDKINNQTAGVTYNNTGDVRGESVTVIGLNDTDWAILSKTGTWTTGS
jgi:hypothetical protein